MVVDYIKYRLNKGNKNFVLSIVGETGQGKSWAALRLAEKIDPNFKAKKQVCFNLEEFTHIINHGGLKQGQVVIIDEAGVSYAAKSWQSNANKLMGFIMQTFRHRNLCVIMTVPLIGFVDKTGRNLTQAILEMKSITKNYSTGKFYDNIVLYRADKSLQAKPRFVYSKKMCRVDSMHFKKPSLKTRRAYEIMAEKFKRDVASFAESDIKTRRELEEQKTEKKTFAEMVNHVKNNISEFLTTLHGKEKISLSKIRMEFNCGQSAASNIKNAISGGF